MIVIILEDYTIPWPFPSASRSSAVIQLTNLTIRGVWFYCRILCQIRLRNHHVETGPHRVQSLWSGRSCNNGTPQEKINASVVSASSCFQQFLLILPQKQLFIASSQMTFTPYKTSKSNTNNGLCNDNAFRWIEMASLDHFTIEISTGWLFNANTSSSSYSYRKI